MCELKQVTTKPPSVENVYGLEDTCHMAVGLRDMISYTLYMSCCFDAIHETMIPVVPKPCFQWNAMRK